MQELSHVKCTYGSYVSLVHLHFYSPQSNIQKLFNFLQRIQTMASLIIFLIHTHIQLILTQCCTTTQPNLPQEELHKSIIQTGRTYCSNMECQKKVLDHFQHSEYSRNFVKKCMTHSLLQYNQSNL